MLPSAKHDLGSPKQREAENHPKVGKEELNEEKLVLVEGMLDEGQVSSRFQDHL